MPRILCARVFMCVHMYVLAGVRYKKTGCLQGTGDNLEEATEGDRALILNIKSVKLTGTLIPHFFLALFLSVSVVQLLCDAEHVIFELTAAIEETCVKLVLQVYNYRKMSLQVIECLNFN